MHASIGIHSKLGRWGFDGPLGDICYGQVKWLLCVRSWCNCSLQQPVHSVCCPLNLCNCLLQAVLTFDQSAYISWLPTAHKKGPVVDVPLLEIICQRNLRLILSSTEYNDEPTCLDVLNKQVRKYTIYILRKDMTTKLWIYIASELKRLHFLQLLCQCCL